MDVISTRVSFLVMNHKHFQKHFLNLFKFRVKDLINTFRYIPYTAICFANTLLFSFITINSYSQNVSVELSIEWQTNNIKLPQEEYSTSSFKYTPYLCITYRNYTNSDIYCLKLINEGNKYPLLNSNILHGLSTSNISDYNFSNKNFMVYIDASVFRNGYWQITSDTSNMPTRTDQGINGILGDFYDYAREISEFNFDSIVPYHFSVEDVTANSIAKNNYNDFVFLKNNELYTEKFNLLGFYLLGGNYTFYLKDQSFTNYILGEEYWNVKEQSWVYQEIPLPSIVNGYNLYAGSFNTNSVLVKFKGSHKSK